MKHLGLIAILFLMTLSSACRNAGTQEVSDDTVQVDSMLSMDSLEIDTLQRTDTL